MIAQGGGKIINIGSNLAEVIFAGYAVYSAAKAGTHHLTRALANEWAGQGIHVNCVAPCITETPTRANLFARPGYKEWVEEQMSPIGRWAQPEDMVGHALPGQQSFRHGRRPYSHGQRRLDHLMTHNGRR